MERAAEIFLKNGCTVIYISIDRKAAGFLVLSDILRPDAPRVIEQIKQTGVVPVLFTGDHENAALYIANQLSITDLRSNGGNRVHAAFPYRSPGLFGKAVSCRAVKGI